MKTDTELKAMSIEALESLDDAVIAEQSTVSRAKDPARFQQLSAYIKRIEDAIFAITE